MEIKNKIALRRILYVTIYIVSVLPIACAYVMEGGDILIWLARIEEVKDHLLAGNFLLFPTAELTVARGGQYAALNSNLWLFVPAVIRMLGGNITVTYRIYMLVLNVIALFAAKMLFEELFEDKLAALFGVLLYITCPYRVYISYDKASLGMAVAWALIPLAMWGMMRIFRAKANWKTMLITSVTVAAIGYADSMLMLIFAGVSVLGIIWYRKIWGIVPLLAGGMLFLPGAIYMLRYLLKGGMEVWNLPLGSIAPKGYVLGQFFSSWVYRADCPGLGLGLLMALMVLLWLCFTEGNLQLMKKYGYFVIMLILLSFMSMQAFPWDVVQRVGIVFLRLIPLMETPGICFGFASLAAAVLGAYGVECTVGQKNLFVKVGVPLMIGIAAIGISVYICNTLTYSRLPMFLTDSLV